MGTRTRHLSLVGSTALSYPLDDQSADRRQHDRRSVADLPWLRDVRFRYGPRVRVLDLSRGGVQIETDDYRLQPGRTVALEIAARTGIILMPAGVLRAHIAGLSPHTVYRGGLAFKRALTIQDERLSIADEEPIPGAEAFNPASPTAPAPAAMPIEIVHPTGAADLEPGWHRLVVRYIDGRMLKGYGREFAASSGSLFVWPQPDAAAAARVTVPLWHVKAVFFVRDFVGNADSGEGMDGRAEAAESGRRPHRGRRVAVTFLDGETLTGTTFNYNPQGVGFFLQPLEGGNNVRVFVVCRAIRHVQIG